MTTPPDSQDQLRGQVARQARRMQRAEKERKTLLSQTVFLGTLGLVLVLPVVIGAYVGNWLDGLSAGYSVRWTIGLIFLGLVVGGWNVYLMIRE